MIKLILSGFEKILFLSMFFIVASCSTTQTISYKPISLYTGNGKIKINRFAYKPESKNKKRVIDQNQIDNTAMGSVLIDTPVGQYISNAFLLEFKSAGYKIQNGNYTLNGIVHKFMADDLGFSVDWTLKIEYWIVDSKMKEVYRDNILVEKNTGKWGSIPDMINVAIVDAFEKFTKNKKAMIYFEDNEIGRQISSNPKYPRIENKKSKAR